MKVALFVPPSAVEEVSMFVKEYGHTPIVVGEGNVIEVVTECPALVFWPREKAVSSATWGALGAAIATGKVVFVLGSQLGDLSTQENPWLEDPNVEWGVDSLKIFMASKQWASRRVKRARLGLERLEG